MFWFCKQFYCVLFSNPDLRVSGLQQRYISLDLKYKFLASPSPHLLYLTSVWVQERHRLESQLKGNCIKVVSKLNTIVVFLDHSYRRSYIVPQLQNKCYWIWEPPRHRVLVDICTLMHSQRFFCMWITTTMCYVTTYLNRRASVGTDWWRETDRRTDKPESIQLYSMVKSYRMPETNFRNVDV